MSKKIMFPGVVGVAPAQPQPYRQGGVQAQHARAGARTVNGARVVGKRTGMLDGERIVVLAMSDGTERTYRNGALVEGLTGRTDVLAGPVQQGAPGSRPSRIGRRDGESAADRHQRVIDSITYDTAASAALSAAVKDGLRRQRAWDRRLPSWVDRTPAAGRRR